MKKTIIIASLIFGLAFGNSKAENTEIDSTVKVENPAEVSSFCIAIVKGDFDTVKKLIDLGEDVNQKSNGMAPLHYAAKYNRVEIAELLIDKGAKVSTKCNKGYTAQKYAELSNAKDVAQLLKNFKKKNA
ncbi:ankyrin repeat domain-containing protein [Paucihalobacter sp.]|uniref:ankyrin repeat domain-containing protein n=1 Tax=Paucihalobacter sp. TaxID=2850405 RepID=UPI002FE0EB5C